MPRRLLPRHPRDLRGDYRGQILAVYGLVWVGMGLNVTHDGDPATWSTLVPFNLVPPHVRGGLWIITGLLAVLYAIRPRCIHSDGLGFAALYVMPAWRVLAFTWSWAGAHIDLGGPGYPRGWVWALLHLVMVVAVMRVASWPNPPKASDKGRR